MLIITLVPLVTTCSVGTGKLPMEEGRHRRSSCRCRRAADVAPPVSAGFRLNEPICFLQKLKLSRVCGLHVRFPSVLKKQSHAAYSTNSKPTRHHVSEGGAKGPHFLPTRASGGRETFGTWNVAALWLKIPTNDNNLPVLNLTSNLVPSLQS